MFNENASRSRHRGSNGRDRNHASAGGFASSFERRGRTNSKDAPSRYVDGRRVCHFWDQGRCNKGENCTFHHPYPPLYQLKRERQTSTAKGRRSDSTKQVSQHNSHHQSITYNRVVEDHNHLLRDCFTEEQRKVLEKQRQVFDAFCPDESRASSSEIHRFHRLNDIYASRLEILDCVRRYNLTMVIGSPGCGKSTQIGQYLAEDARGEPILFVKSSANACSVLSHTVTKQWGNVQGAIVCKTHILKRELVMDRRARIVFVTPAEMLNQAKCDGLDRFSVVVIDDVDERELLVDLCVAITRKLRKKTVLLSSSTSRNVSGIMEALGIDRRQCVFVPDSGFNEVSIRYLTDDAKSCDDFQDSEKILTQCRYFKQGNCRHDSHHEMYSHGTKSLNVIAEVAARVAKIHGTCRDLTRTILVFLQDPSDLNKATQALSKQSCRNLIWFCIHRNSSSKKLQQLFDKTKGKRKVIFATDMARYFLSLPNVGYVIDTKSSETAVEQCEGAVSKSTADARAQQCFRRKFDGHCYRLYTRSDYESMVDVHEPAILDQDLSALILWTERLKYQIHELRFITEPREESIKASRQLLMKLAALDPATTKITELGKDLLRIPLDLQLGTLLITAQKSGSQSVLSTCAAVVTLLQSKATIHLPLAKHERKGVVTLRNSELFQSDGDLLSHLQAFQQFVRRDEPGRQEFCNRYKLNSVTLSFLEKQFEYTLRLIEENIESLKSSFERILFPNDKTLEKVRLLYAHVFHMNLCQRCSDESWLFGVYCFESERVVFPFPNCVDDSNGMQLAVFERMNDAKYVKNVCTVPYSTSLNSNICRMPYVETKSFKLGNQVAQMLKKVRYRNLKVLEDAFSGTYLNLRGDDLYIVVVHHRLESVEPALMQTLHQMAERSGMIGIWKWADDNDELQPYPDRMQVHLDALLVGTSMKSKIGRFHYVITRTSFAGGEQKNTTTQKVRSIMWEEQPRQSSDNQPSAVITESARSRVNSKGDMIELLNLDAFGQKPVFWKNDADVFCDLEKLETMGVYDYIVTHFFATVEQSKFQIVSVEAVEFSERFELYQSYRLVKKARLTDLNEKFLFHGTKSETVASICSTGFLRDYGTVMKYGNGVYFARDASYSVHDRYSPPDSSGIKTMLWCLVLCGEICPGREGMKRPETKPDHSEFECMVNNVEDPTIFVAATDSMAIPIARIRFRKK